MNNYKTFWDEDTGTATFRFIDSGRVYEGKAICHPEDFDFKNEFTGMQIAHMRAIIAFGKDEKIRLEGKVRGLKQLEASINCSKHYDRKSYEATMLRRQIAYAEAELHYCREDLLAVKTELKCYLESKAKLYSELRKKRKKKADSSNN